MSFDSIKLAALAFLCVLRGFLKYPALLIVAAVLVLVWMVRFVCWIAG